MSQLAFLQREWPAVFDAAARAEAAAHRQDDEQIVITVYEPDPALWVDGFRRRRPQ